MLLQIEREFSDTNDDVDLDALYGLIRMLSERADDLPDSSETKFGILR
ncbi:MAG: hypothetical protein IKG34_01100 [Solobacterium sp.]|nr:hypothetical protein [Solobacterium sp.]